MERRLQAVAQRMGVEGVDLLALPPGDDFRYLMGYTPHLDERPCYLLYDGESLLLVVPALNAAEAAAYLTVDAVSYADADGPRDAVAQARRRFAGAQVIAVGDTMRADALLLLQDAWPDARFVPGARVTAPVRMIKAPEEIEILRRAAAAADVAVQAAFEACRPGLRETDLRRVVDDAFRDEGVEEAPFGIIASGPNSAYPHHHTSSRMLQPGEPVLADLGALLDGYMSDITRMAFLGDPPPRYQEIHAAVEAAVVAAMDAVHPGVPIHEVDRAARQVIERAGYGDRFIHRTGHGIGLTGHEPPSIMDTNDLLLAPGMVFSIEPGIYLVGQFGVRLEEIVVVGERGAQRLSRLSRDVQTIQT